MPSLSPTWNVYSNVELSSGEVDDRVRVAENEKQNTVQYGDVLFTGSSETPHKSGFLLRLPHILQKSVPE